MQEIKKIVVLGPESTGKSTLCKHLADHYQTVWCAEYARAYLLQHGVNYTFDSLLSIAKGQLNLEDEAVNQATVSHLNGTAPLVIIDTDMYVMKVWCEFVFGKTHSFIEEQIQTRKYHLYLLCNTDLPWVKDELREYPDLATRDVLYEKYRKLMEKQQVPWINIHGTNDQRTGLAIQAIDKLILDKQ